MPLQGGGFQPRGAVDFSQRAFYSIVATETREPHPDYRKLIPVMEHDIWSKWLLESRFGNPQNAEAEIAQLKVLRDRVLDNAQLKGNETLLDVGAGDGLIAFGALERMNESGRVIFADISLPLLEKARSIAERIGVLDRCQFVNASAEDLSTFPDESIDVVTTRSVLIYVADKLRAMREFYRVLKARGRISLFETVSLPALHRANEKWPGVGMNVYPVDSLAPMCDLVSRFVSGLNFASTQSMRNTDHIGYLHLCEDSGFRSVKVELHLASRRQRADLQSVLKQSLNPHFPTQAEHMDAIFSPEERERFVAHLEKLMQTDEGIHRLSTVFVSAVKR